MERPDALLGLLSDQHAGRGGVMVPFMGHQCSTSAAAAIFALRYKCRLLTGFCYRERLGHWRMESGPEIPVQENGVNRPVEAITLDVNRVFEQAVRRDPANWFWVHNRWKMRPGTAPPTSHPSAATAGVPSSFGQPARL